MPQNMRSAGFSLVELSIVLVILGLLVGGVLTGQSLIRASELKALVSDREKYVTAVMTFRDKYFQLPGDMNNATTFWGSAGGTGSDAACQAIASTTTATCNGNGDGFIETSAVAYSERFRAWQHLANAGLIEGSYTGRDGAAVQGTDTDPNFAIAGQNVPMGPMGNSIFSMSALVSVQSGHANYFDGVGGYNLISATQKGGYLLLPEENWNIDTKIDDGKPGKGNVFSGKSTGTWTPLCTTTAVADTAEYRLTYTSKACVLWSRSF